MEEYREYFKFDCHGRDDALHCNHYLYGRSGVECPCIMESLKEIPTGTRFAIGQKYGLIWVESNKKFTYTKSEFKFLWAKLSFRPVEKGAMIPLPLYLELQKK